MKIRYCVYGVILLLVTVWAKQVLAEDAVFRSKEFKFRFIYPGEWIVKKSTGEHIRAEVASLFDGSSCNVIVRVFPEFKGYSDKEVMSKLSEAQLINELKTNFPDIILLKGGSTYISNQLAVYAYTDL